MNKLYDLYEKEIRDFFEGGLITRNTEKDHIWIVDHPDGIETLTVEPRKTRTEYDGGQYEIAVRFRNLYGDELVTFSGYSISCDEHFRGWGTAGH